MSAGSLVGYNILACLENRRTDLSVVATNSVAHEPSLFDCDRVYLVPPTQSDSSIFQKSFLAIVEKECPDLIIPCRDLDVRELAELKESIESRSTATCLCGAKSLAEVMIEKDASCRFAHGCQLPFADTLSLPATRAEIKTFVQTNGLPLIVKPAIGFASKGVFLITEKSQLEKIAQQSGLVLQRFLGDPQKLDMFMSTVADRGVPLFHSFETTKLSLQVFISHSGQIHSCFVTGNKMVMGRSQEVHRITDPELDELARKCGKAFAAKGWRGPLNIQCQRTPEGTDQIYEFNGRFTGATHARYLLGYDELAIAMLDFASVDLPKATVKDHHRVIRYPTGKAAPSINVGELRRHGQWERSG